MNGMLVVIIAVVFIDTMEVYMLLKYIVGVALSMPCIENTYAMQWPSQQELFVNQQEFVGINSLTISGNSGTVIVQPSTNDKTIVSYDNQAEIIREGNRLIVEGPQQRSFFSFFSPACNFRINIPVSVTDLKLNTGQGNMTIDGSHLKNLDISGGNVNVMLKGMRGNVSIRCGSCMVSYLAAEMQGGSKAIFDCDSGSFDFTAYLSDAFTGFCSLIRSASLQIKEVFLPTTNEDKADIVLRGRSGAAKISIKKAGE